MSARRRSAARVIGALLVCGTMVSTGCVSSHVRYTRPSRAGKQSGGSYTVPRDWDYRRHYRVPPDRLAAIIDKYLGTPYRYGGEGRRGMDCSGFVNVVFTELNQARMPRSSRAMSRLGRPVPRGRARPGDLVFFRGGFLNRINHVGIYAGNGRFAHASRSRGVIYSSLDTEYYRKHFAGIRRVF
ncbi:MAG: hypothetical protein GF418_10090 [Chitinivibrionales bacterium]|nr:hypothetical protein [Chitinivibrionales bacterium]MBD3395962.1 hypothetical protein [Chitinivibrionales bacterium]